MASSSGPEGPILLIEDEPLVASSVSRYLKANGFAVEMAVDGSRGLELARSGRYDLVLLDLRIPLVDGVEVLRDTLAHDPEQKVMVVSAIADVDSKVRCLQIGACDYLAKPFSLGELLARVRARLRDAPTPVAPPERFLRVGRTSLDLVRRKADAGDGQVALARREFALLRRLMVLRGEVATREELLEDVWGMAPDAASNVVDVTVARLRAKLGEDVVETVRHVGYRIRV